uniref:Uncharacterized protein n=1 Tax=Oryza rufipogon TaxID=4529 RepID=A0A0E0Q3Z8_ORYRU
MRETLSIKNEFTPEEEAGHDRIKKEVFADWASGSATLKQRAVVAIPSRQVRARVSGRSVSSSAAAVPPP